MVPISGTSSGKQNGTSVACRAGVVRVSSPAILAGQGDGWIKLLERALTVGEVKAIEIDRHRGTAEIAGTGSGMSLNQLLARLAEALADENHAACDARLESWKKCLAGRSRVRLVRRGKSLSTWDILHDLPSRLRVRDVGLAPGSLALEQLRLELAGTAGVKKATVSRLTGSIVVQFDPALIDRDGILTRLDAWTRGGDLVHTQAFPSPAQWLSANATITLAVAGAVVYPPLLAVSAVVLVAGNIPNIREAFTQIRRGQAGMPVLHTAIVGATLATGTYLAPCVMNWLFLYWEERRARMAARGRQLFARTLSQPEATAWVIRDGAELATPVSRLEPGALIAVRQGESVPVDGRVVSGKALVSGDPVRGRNGVVACECGNIVYAGSFVIEGEIRVEALRTGGSTLSNSMSQILAAVATGEEARFPAPAPEFAERAVPPALMTAGFGFLVGDAHLAAAVLRPDYATGPSLGASLALIDRLASCFEDGIFVRRPDVFAQMAEVDTIVFDQSISGERVADSAAAAITELRTSEGLQVELLTNALPPEAGRLADLLGVDGVRHCLSDAQKAAWIHQLRASGNRVAFIGDCLKNPQAGAASNVAIGPIPDGAGVDDVSGVWIREGDFGKVVELLRISRSMRREARRQCNLILIPNVACIAGAFLFGFSSLAVVFLSNVGTWSVYSLGREALRRTERRLATRRNPGFDDRQKAADRRQSPFQLEETRA